MLKDGLLDEVKLEEAEAGEVAENGLISSGKKVTLWTNSFDKYSGAHYTKII